MTKEEAIARIKDHIVVHRYLERNAVKILEALDMAIKALEQPERKKGRWIERNPNNDPECRLIECSECGNAYIVGMNLPLEDWSKRRNFCIRCGADMRQKGADNG